MKIPTGRRRVVAAVAAVTAVLLPSAVARAAEPPVPIQLLAINDFHGNLEPPAGGTGMVTTQGAGGKPVEVPAGGAAYLATHLKRARKQHSLTVSAGDNIGASPLLSAAYHDEPTIESLGLMGLRVSTVGNHEFDEGLVELKRMQEGGCHPQDGCAQAGRPFRGASFPYLAANVIETATGKPIFPPYVVRTAAPGVKIGFLGMTLKDTPADLEPAAAAGLRFLDEVSTARKYVPELRREGVEAIVLLLHQGGKAASQIYDYDCDAGGPGSGLSGPIVGLAEQLDPEIDLIVAGHTNQSHVCTIPDPGGARRLVTSTSSFTKMFTDITLPYDRQAGDFVRSGIRARNVIVTRDVPEDPDQAALIARWEKLIAPVANKVVGYIAKELRGRGSEALEKPLGKVIADAQLAAGKSQGARVAFVTPGAIRSDLVYENGGAVTYARVFAVQPFSTPMTTLDLTGAQIVTLLRQQFINQSRDMVLQVSEGFTYTVDTTKSGGDQVVASSIRLDGKALEPGRTYRVTANDYVASGGDNFTVMREGQNRVSNGTDTEALADYLQVRGPADDPVTEPADRITFRTP
ncbi:bifunctional metallophosphatase/5'-nucleotidase [Nonomuraea sp. PA05]|uniref:bifunctional metallophosphatase/5'-nucleotidase n=1 Tax=Nonomuraea sp. PA05 TaxID=2604466 RepID=UPI0011D8A14F|nr:bifunctional metallophosphatase/5'-nucleotidase [Nonomuraea sp. PA05]TYB50924.1 bifunctional metallophosphatase/5'-nucleotidase [Nonomuraea sp. PA05]